MSTPEYDKAHYERVGLKVKKGWLRPVKEAARAQNVSLTKYIVEAVESRLALEKNTKPLKGDDTPHESSA